ncbi:MAG: PhoU domain-containing protein [Archaeoglobaceae archaeon]
MGNRDVRKVYRSGKGSYIITLPKEWIVANGLKEGDTVYLEVRKDTILISPRSRQVREEAEIDSKDASFNQLVRLIISHYLAGYDSIRVKTRSDEQRRAVAFAVDMLVGAEIMEDTGNEVVIEVFLDSKRFNIIDIIEKIFNICSSMLSDFCSCLKEFDRAICSSIMVRESEVDKIHFLALRLLNVAMEREEKGLSSREIVSYRSVVRALERIADHVSSMAEALVNLQSSFPEICDAVKDVEEIFRIAMISFFKKNTEMAEEVLEKYEIFENKVQKNYEEILKFDVVRVLNLKTVFDSLCRIAAYSADIAEVVLDMSV